MVIKKNIQVGKSKFLLILFVFLSHFIFISKSISNNKLEGSYTELKILDKISSKNTLLNFKNAELIKFKDLSIKSLKCKNSEFDDNPEIVAYVQVRDLTNEKNDEVFVLMDGCFHQAHL